MPLGMHQFVPLQQLELVVDVKSKLLAMSEVRHIIALAIIIIFFFIDPLIVIPLLRAHT
jgi:hypothetical protein